MYAEYFGLREPPFNITPDPRFLYLNDCYQEALADEVAAAAGLVMEKDSAVAAALVRGVHYTAGVGGAAARLVRRPEFDLFR